MRKINNMKQICYCNYGDTTVNINKAKLMFNINGLIKTSCMKFQPCISNPSVKEMLQNST